MIYSNQSNICYRDELKCMHFLYVLNLMVLKNRLNFLYAKVLNFAMKQNLDLFLMTL